MPATKKMLVSTDASITDIAFSSGFGSFSSLFMCFSTAGRDNTARIQKALAQLRQKKLSLLYGDGDHEKTICIATNFGEDTDCTPGTVGAANTIKKGCRLALGRLSGAGNNPMVELTERLLS